MPTVIIPPLLRAAAGGVGTVEVAGDTLGRVFGELTERFPGLTPVVYSADGEVSPSIGVFLNDRQIAAHDVARTVALPGDQVSLAIAAEAGDDAAWQKEARTRLALLVRQAATARGVTVIEVVGGTGTGKTTVVTTVAAESAHLFSDGQVIIPMDRHDAVSSAVETLLTAVGHATPVDRSVSLDAYHRRVEQLRLLIVLDGAVAGDGVAALIPRGGRSCVIVTSQYPLGLDATHTLELAPPSRPAQGVATGVGGTPASAVMGQPHEPVLAGYVSDSVTGSDQLGIGRDVEALAALIASKDIAPPLSIGLFGDWGTGKSFLMRSLEARIGTLGELSREARRAGDDTAFCSHVRQISFNAWHFADANLWASLVTRIWEGLAEPGTQRAQMARDLPTSQLAVDRLSRDEQEARRRGEELEKELDELEQRTRDLDEARRLAEDLAGIRGHAAALAQRLGNASRREVGWLAGGALGLAAFVTVLLLVPAGTKAIAAALSAVGAVSGLYTGLRQPLRDMREATASIDALGDRLLNQQGAGRNAREQRLQAEIATARARMDQVRDELAAANRRQRETREEIEEVRSGREPYRFIAQRLASDDYERHLGIMALIRRDFECLADLLRERDADGHPPDGEHETAPRIDRVVLYIDDLDRCPATRVVEVLEAVHLLLAFELFVVVVAVDVRWLLRSLEQHYATELSSGAPTGIATDTSWRSTPQNYLEKIFQIPFAVRPMSRDGFSRLIGSLFSTSDAAEGVRQDGRSDDIRTNDAATPADRADVVPDAATAHADPSADRILNPSALRLSDAELELMKELYGLLPTPRAVKRFANTYRLLRASLPAVALSDFIGNGHGGDFRAAQILLATMIGVAGADRLFACLLNDPPDAITQAIAAAGAEEAAPESDDGAQPAEQRSLAMLARVVAELARQQAIPHETASYVRLLPQVTRYSFTSARIDGSG